MTTYHWKSKTDYGSFGAQSDEEALDIMPDDCILLYCETETEGDSLFILYELQ